MNRNYFKIKLKQQKKFKKKEKKKFNLLKFVLLREAHKNLKNLKVFLNYVI